MNDECSDNTSVPANFLQWTNLRPRRFTFDMHQALTVTEESACSRGDREDPHPLRGRPAIFGGMTG